MAWVGDSQAMLFRRGKGLDLVNPHKPDREVLIMYIMYSAPYVMYTVSRTNGPLYIIM